MRASQAPWDVTHLVAGAGNKIQNTHSQQGTHLCAATAWKDEQKTETPVMWQTAKAWLEYMFGSKEQSAADIRQAVNMQGNERMMDCARAIRIYIETALAKAHNTDFDNWIGPELQMKRNK